LGLGVSEAHDQLDVAPEDDAVLDPVERPTHAGRAAADDERPERQRHPDARQLAEPSLFAATDRLLLKGWWREGRAGTGAGGTGAARHAVAGATTVFWRSPTGRVCSTLPSRGCVWGFGDGARRWSRSGGGWPPHQAVALQQIAHEIRTSTDGSHEVVRTPSL
jgi:hypothetical protein